MTQHFANWIRYQLCSKWNTFLRHLFTEVDASGLAFNRIVLGILLLLDIINERGLSRADLIWSDDDDSNTFQCRFPLFESVTRLRRPEAMFAVYFVMVLGITGVILGYFYRLSALLYSVSYWYLLLIEKSRWNNHSYLFGLFSLLNLTNSSHVKWSLDSRRSSVSNGTPPATVPYWQYFLFRFQIFLVYFYAGVKKTNLDWLGGHSMVALSSHWIWYPAIWVGVPSAWIDYFVIHLCGFIFDSVVGFLFIFRPTKPLAFGLCGFFNLANSQMFQIGMFPWVMLAVMPLFCEPDWPVWVAGRVLIKNPPAIEEPKPREFLTLLPEIIEPEPDLDVDLFPARINEEPNPKLDTFSPTKTTTNLRRRTSKSISVMEDLIMEPVSTGPISTRRSRIPAFISARFHSKNLTKFFGFELKTYLKNWRLPAKIPAISASQKLETSRESMSLKNRFTVSAILLYILVQVSLPFAYPLLPGYNTWTNGLYGYSFDMMIHNWNHLHTRVTVRAVSSDTGNPVTLYLNPDSWTLNARWSHHADMAVQFAHCVKDRLERHFHLKQIELYLDVWTSLNGRFTQRMYDPEQNILNVQWSPFQPNAWVRPILGGSEEWRDRLETFDRQIAEANGAANGSFLIYIADVPGTPLLNYIDETLFTQPATLFVLSGLVHVRIRPSGREYFASGPDGRVPLPLGSLVAVSVFGAKPAHYALLYAEMDGRRGAAEDATAANFPPKVEPRVTAPRNGLLTSLHHLALGGRFIAASAWILLRKSVVLSSCQCSSWRWW